MSRTEAASTIWAVMPAAGRGLRLGAEIPKQYLSLAGRPLLAHSLAVLLAEARFAGVVLVVAPDDERWRDIPEVDEQRVQIVHGGTERHESVLQGLKAVPAAGDPWVAVHDAARPCLDAADLTQLLDGLDSDDCGRILAAPAADTLKQVDEAGQIQATLDRYGIWQAQTPQVFRRSQLLAALQDCARSGFVPTDEAAAVEQAGGRVAVCMARSPNPKITTTADLRLAEGLLARRD